MSIVGKFNDKESGIYLSLIKNRLYKDQVGTIIAVNGHGKTIGEFIDIFSDGSIHFIHGNDSNKLPDIYLDDLGRLMAISLEQKRFVKSSKCIVKNDGCSEIEIKGFIYNDKLPLPPIIGIDGYYDKMSLSPYQIQLTILEGKYYSVQVSLLYGSKTTGAYNMFDINNRGIVSLYTINSAYKALDLSCDNEIKIRGELPELYTGCDAPYNDNGDEYDDDDECDDDDD